MNDFLVTPPFLRIALWVAMENRAFTHSRNEFFFLRLNCFCIQRVSKNKLAPIKIVLGARLAKLDAGV